MASDNNNPGQFGSDRPDTQAAASDGGKASSGKFGDKNSANPSDAGKKGAKAQPKEAKAEGGRHSHSGGK